MALTKVASTNLYTLQLITTTAFLAGSAIDVSTYYGADLKILVGRASGTGFTTSPVIRVEGSHQTGTPNPDQWKLLAGPFSPALGASIGAQAVSSGGTSGTNTVTLAAGTNFSNYDYIFLKNGTLANSEWARVLGVSGAALTLEENLANNQTSGNSTNVYSQAEQYGPQLDLSSINKLRLVVDNYNGGVSVVVTASFGAVTAL